MGFFFAIVCYPCAQQLVRKEVLIDDMDRYQCCQGYFNVPGLLQAGNMGETKCPNVCLATEALLCPCFAAAASRNLVSDYLGIQSDPCDRRILACRRGFERCCECCGEQAPVTMGKAANAVYCLLFPCMTVQVHYELQQRIGELNVHPMAVPPEA